MKRLLFTTAVLLAVVIGQASAQKSKFRVLVLASRAADHIKMMEAAKPFFSRLATEGGFALDYTDDTSKIKTANLRNYDVFVMLQLAPFDMAYAQQDALQKFCEEGKGWVGIHAAGLTGKQFLGPETRYWQWFEGFMGGITYSPHPKFQQATVIVEDRKHPATINLPAKFTISDEWYEFDKSPRGKVRVLTSVDERTYHQNKPMGDHPIIWTNEQFRRMIYIGIGHSPDDFSHKDYITLIHDAIFWAASK